MYRRGFDLDPSCKLWMPYYRHGLEVGAKFPDYSGNNNHGTIVGVVPATYPILSGVDLVTNGGFDSATTGWTGTNCTLASIAGGQSGNCLEITRTGGVTQSASQTLSLINGKRYKLPFWVKSGTSSNESYQINVGSGAYAQSTGTSSASWSYGELIFIADSGQADWQNVYLVKNSATAGTMLFDTISVQEVVGYEGLGWHWDIIDDRVVHPSLNLGTSHTLYYWIKKYPGNSGVVHGGAANYHGLRVTDTLVGYNANTTEVTVNHGLTWVQLQQNKNLFSVVRSGTSVAFYLNGSQIGTTQTLLANSNLTVTDIGRYSDGTSYFGNNIFEIINFNINHTAQEIRNYYELTRHIFGV